jgi:23S rRNA (guanosine2251-2'-O)-methyltransferase
MRDIVLIAHNVRSTHNVGSLLRTADGLGVKKVYLTGYTPYPMTNNDTRMPHEAAKLNKQITKTALGAEKFVDWNYSRDIFTVLDKLKRNKYRVVALEQTPLSVVLADYKPPQKICLIVGREVEGIEREILDEVDDVVEVIMYGKKESLNVVQAAAIALYALNNIV